MFKNNLINLFIILFSLTLIKPASATLIDFEVSNLGVVGGQAYNEVSLIVDGIEVTVTAYNIINDGDGNIDSLNLLNADGTGVYVSSSDNLGVVSHDNDGHHLDGGNDNNVKDDDNSIPDFDEGLLFTFDQVVRLNYIDFDSFDTFDGYDDFNLTVDGVLYLADFDIEESSPYASQAFFDDDSKFDFHSIVGTSFLFWADGNSDGFRIDYFNVTAVPEPNSILLLALALLFFVMGKRKKSIKR